jgi:hypothetical protein
MSLPETDRTRLRTALYGLTLVALLAIPTLLGFRIAAAGVTQPPNTGEVAELPDRTAALEGLDAPQIIESRPLGDAPSSTEDALTRRASSDTGIDRLTFIDENGDTFGIDNGTSISLGDGLSLTVLIDPFPPARFDVGVGFELTQDGVPVTDATFDTVWDMTFMRHGPFLKQLDNSGSGTYAAEFEFFMFGPWEVNTVLTTPSDRHEFTVSVYVWPN